MKTILFVGDAKSIHLKKWVDYFVDREYRVFLATFSSENITKCRNVFFLSSKPIKVKGNNFHYFISLYKLSKIIKKTNPHYINAHFSYSMGLIALISMIISGSKAELSVVCHGSDVLDYPSFFCKYINKYVLSNAGKIVAVSSQIADVLYKWSIRSEKIFVGQYGVPSCAAKYTERDIDIISIRNYVENSRIDQVLSKLDNEYFVNKKIVFVLPHITATKLRKLKELYPRVEMHESLEHDIIIKLLQRSKVYISATLSDGSSLSLMEAMAAGAIPVVSNIPSNREWIVEMLNGELFAYLDKALPAIRRILEMSCDEREKIQQLNWKLIENRGDYIKQMGKIEEFLFDNKS